MKLTFVLAEKCKVKNVNSQKYPSHKTKMHKRSCISPPEIRPQISNDWNKRIISSDRYNISQIPYNWRLNRVRIYIFLHLCALSNLPIANIIALFWSCGSSENCEFWVISLHCKQRHGQTFHYCSSKLHLMCGWSQQQLHCLQRM